MGASTPPGVGTGLAYNSIGLGRSLAQPVAIQAPAGGAALLTATMASITGGAGPLRYCEIEDVWAAREITLTWSAERRLLPAAGQFRRHVLARAAAGLVPAPTG